MRTSTKVLTLVSLTTGLGLLGLYLYGKRQKSTKEKKKKTTPKDKNVVFKGREEFDQEIISYKDGIDRTIYWDLDISMIPEDILIYLSFLKKNYKSVSIKTPGMHFLSYDQIIEMSSKIKHVNEEGCFVAISKDEITSEKEGKPCYMVYDNLAFSENSISLVSIQETELMFYFGLSSPEGIEHPLLKTIISL